MHKNILIAGGTGLIGKRLIEYLGNDKYKFRVLSRSKSGLQAGVQYFNWDPNTHEMDPQALKNVDVLINLAGASIADKKWTEKRKRHILESRLKSIQTLSKSIADLDIQPDLLIGASAVGYYGDRGSKILSEADLPGSGFLSEVCQKWENEYTELKKMCNRHIILRIGIVLSTKGGALKEILKPTNAGIYGYFGSGKAIYPWIHIDDICEIISQAIDSSEYSGVVNAVAPNPISIKKLLLALKKAKNKIGLNIPVPDFILKMILGEMSTMLTNSAHVIPSRLNKLNHQFLYEEAEGAIKNLLKESL